METMRRDDFKMEFDQKKEIWYVCRAKDEMTKNHKSIESLVTGYMPENPTDHLCPIKSWVKYTSHLHPENPYL